MEEKKARISFKVSGLEVECEGSEEFITNSMLDMVNQVLDLCCDKQEAITSISKISPAPNPNPGANGLISERPKLDKSTNTIALELGAKSGPKLAMAAVAHLNLVKGQSTFTRNEILEEMKSATSIYKQTFGNNLTASLDRLIKAKRLLLNDKDTYALPETERSALEEKLA